MSLLERMRRVWIFDLARGFFILVMMVSHNIFFIHKPVNPFLQLINGIGDFVSFTGLLFIAGASAYPAYIGSSHTHQHMSTKVIKRLMMYVLGYVSLSLFVGILRWGWSTKTLIEIVTLQRLVPFTEFILPFIILGLLKIPLRAFYQWAVSHPLHVIGVMMASYGIGSLLYPLTSIMPVSWKAIWVSHEGVFSFPLFHYFPVYLLGMYLGKVYQEHRNAFSLRLGHMIYITIVLSALLSGTYMVLGNNLSQVYGRWPPTLPFLALSTIVALMVVFIFLKSNELKRLPWTRNLLLVFGQNAFALFFTHTALIHLYDFFGFPKIYGFVFFVLVSIIIIVLAVYVAHVLPLNFRTTLTFIKWCECQVGYCVHAKEPTLIRWVKHSFIKVGMMPHRLSFTIFSRKVQPMHPTPVFLSIALVLAVVTPLGYVENELIKQTVDVNVKGELDRLWYIPQYTPLATYSINLSPLVQQEKVMDVAAVINGQSYPMTKEEDKWLVDIPLLGMAYGQYEVYTNARLKDTVFNTKTSTFMVSAPLMITWTIDWEGYDVPDAYLNKLSHVADQFGIPMTHLFNPRIYTDPELPLHRQQRMTDYVIERRNLSGEEIGLHLHMFPDFVQASGVAPKLEPVWGGGFSYGYDMLTTNYDYDETKQIISFAKRVFNEKGLGWPKSYRAGAWFADIDTLKALADNGFLVDSSARTAYAFGTNQIKGYWDVSVTAQPYFPSIHDQNRDTPPPNLTIMEIPNNGADDYAFSSADMIERFYANYQKELLATPKQVTYLSHPQWFNPAREQKMRQVFGEISRHTYHNDQGPVVFATLMDVYDIFNVKP